MRPWAVGWGMSIGASSGILEEMRSAGEGLVVGIVTGATRVGAESETCSAGMTRTSAGRGPLVTGASSNAGQKDGGCEGGLPRAGRVVLVFPQGTAGMESRRGVEER